MRGDAQQRFALGERLGHEAKLVVLEIPQPAVDQLGRGRGSRRGKVARLGEQHRKAAAGGVARDSGAVDAAADDQQIVARTRHGGAL